MHIFRETAAKLCIFMQMPKEKRRKSAFLCKITQKTTKKMLTTLFVRAASTKNMLVF